ncbi:MAG TPA: hypothetical protein DCO83_09580 [Mucilaginibacter sp.]|nr:hypothetical protein [Mucilaginibacter sp.]
MLDEQGTYELNVAYTITATGKSAVIPFTLTRQSAVLTAPTVMITETGCDLVSDQLLLKEASGKAGVQLTDLPVPAVPGIKSGKLITFGKTAISIPAAGQQPVPFHIDSIAFKELPLGKTTATMLIASKTLAAPLTVQFEIWNKRSKWWIVVIVLAGLLVGFLVKHFLKDKRDYNQARLNALDEIRDITTYTISVQDPGFQASVKIIIGDLQMAIDQPNGFSTSSSATALNTATTAATTAYNNLKTTFETSLQIGINNFQTLSGQLYDIGYEKPVRDRLTTAIATLQLAKHELDVYNPTQANVLLAQATAQATAGLTSYLSYAATMLAFFTTQTNYYPAPPPWPATWTNIQTQITPIQTDMTAISPVGTPIQTMLTLVNQVQQAWKNLVAYIAQQVLQDYQNASPTAAADPNFTSAFNSWLSALTDIVNNAQLSNAASFYWNAVLLTQLNNTWVNLTAPALATRMGNIGNRTITPAWNPIAKLMAQPVATKPVFQFNNRQLDTISKSYQVILKDYWYYTFLQSGLLAILICLGALMTYGKNFIGTSDDLISLFFFAFSLDLTVDSIAQFKAKPTGGS